MISQTSRRSFLTVTAVLALGLSAWGQCSNASVTGKYGYAGGGLDKSGNPIRVLGYFNANGKGTFKGNESGSDGGSIVTNLPVTGTYSVNPDCNGSGTITPKGGKVSHFTLVVLSGGKNLQYLTTDSPNVQAGTAQAQGKATCTVASIKGNFGIEAGGVFLSVGAVAFDGLFMLDGKGTVSGTESGSIAGTIFTTQPVSGSYTVASNCTGTMTLMVDGQTEHSSFVVTNSGQSLLVVETDKNTVVSGFGQQ